MTKTKKQNLFLDTRSYCIVLVVGKELNRQLMSYVHSSLILPPSASRDFRHESSCLVRKVSIQFTS